MQMEQIGYHHPNQRRTRQKNLEIKYLKYSVIGSVFFSFIILLGVAHQYYILYKSYFIELSPRTIFQKPKPPESQIIMYKLSNGQQKQQIFNNEYCVFLNSVNLISNNTISTIQKILQDDMLGTVYLMADGMDIYGRDMMEERLKANIQEEVYMEFDSNYQQIAKIKDTCTKMVYLFGNFVINEQMLHNIKQQTSKLNPQQLYYSSKYMHKTIQSSLAPLSIADLTKISIPQLYKYLYILPTEFLSLITSLNFVYYTKYTIQELILIPLLILYQSNSQLITSEAILHQFNVSFMQMKEVKLKEPARQRAGICFVSYPNNPYQQDDINLKEYLQSILNQGTPKELPIKFTIVIYLPWNQNNSHHLFATAKCLNQFIKNKNLSLKIRLRIMNEKAVSTHAVYQSVYSYCPHRSIIVSSRHNVRFDSNFSQQLMKTVNQKYHYYFVNQYYQHGSLIHFDNLPTFKQNEEIRRSNYFQQKLQHVQIFKSDLMKMVSFSLLKSKQFDFYETQSAFVTFMMELTNFRIKLIQKPLILVKERKFTQTQLKERGSVKKYAEFVPMPSNILLPYRYSSLQNPAYKRNAPLINTKIIHQIWIGQSKISNIRMKLHETIKQANLNFQVKLWRTEDITKQMFPLTYYLVQKVFEENKESQLSIFAIAADLLRYESIYRFGGIYIDFKFEGRKPLDQFLKYEIFFIDTDIKRIRFGSPKAVGNGVMGAVPNNYYLGMVLNELILQQNVNSLGIIPYLTGSFVLRTSMTTQQVFTQVGFGCHLIIPHPYDNIVNECGGIDKTFDPDQQVYEITALKSAITVKIGIPCKQYPDAYLINYSPLSKTWIASRSNSMN